MTAPADTADDDASPPRSDLADAALWALLGAAVLADALSMDRLGSQDVPPFGAPGLLPGLLGIALLLMGALLAARSLRRGALSRPASAPASSAAPGRAVAVIGLCVLFGAGLVGHGLPFWAASALFVTATILALRPPGRPLARAFAGALATGLAAGAVITLVFQQLFLVRLP